MAKMTLLELVQKVLNSISGDEVSGIGDTVEAMQVANIIEDVYHNIVTNTRIPEHASLLKVDGLSDSTMPNYLKLPTTVANISSFRYDRTTDVTTDVEYREVKYLSPETFIRRLVGRNQSDSNMQVVTDFSGIKFVVQNDKMPDVWTSFDDLYMVFDSFDNTYDTTLQSSKSMAFGFTIPVFTLSDTFTPDLDENLFPLLLNESKSWAATELKQQTNQKAEQQARRQRVTFQNDKERFTKESNYTGYGRK